MFSGFISSISIIELDGREIYDSSAARSTSSPSATFSPHISHLCIRAYSFSSIKRHLPTRELPLDLFHLTYLTPLHIKPSLYSVLRSSAVLFSVLGVLISVYTPPSKPKYLPSTSSDTGHSTGCPSIIPTSSPSFIATQSLKLRSESLYPKRIYLFLPALLNSATEYLKVTFITREVYSFFLP